MQHSLVRRPSRTGPVMLPGIDILHELGNRALSGSKKPRRRRTLQSLTIENLYCLFAMPQRLAARCSVSASRT